MDRCRHDRGSGFTLVELLIGLVILSLSFAAALAILHVVQNSVIGQDQKNRLLGDTAYLIAELRRDVSGIWIPEDPETCPLLLEQAENGRSWQLTFCHLVPEPGTRDLRWSSSVQTDYRYTTDGNDLHAVVKISEHPEQRLAVTNILYAGAAEVRILLLEEGQWKTNRTMAAREGKASVPSAIRITVIDPFKDTPLLSTDLALPVALTGSSEANAETGAGP